MPKCLVAEVSDNRGRGRGTYTAGTANYVPLLTVTRKCVDFHATFDDPMASNSSPKMNDSV